MSHEPDAIAPAGDEAAPGSEGTGEDLCPTCGGSGQKDGMVCPTCDGAGAVTDLMGGG